MHHCSCSHGIVDCELSQLWYCGLCIIAAMISWVVNYSDHGIVGCDSLVDQVLTYWSRTGPQEALIP